MQGDKEDITAEHVEVNLVAKFWRQTEERRVLWGGGRRLVAIVLSVVSRRKANTCISHSKRLATVEISE